MRQSRTPRWGKGGVGARSVLIWCLVSSMLGNHGEHHVGPVLMHRPSLLLLLLCLPFLAAAVPAETAS